MREKNDFSLVEKIHRLLLGKTGRRKQRDKTSLSKRFEERERERAIGPEQREQRSNCILFLSSFCLGGLFLFSVLREFCSLLVFAREDGKYNYFLFCSPVSH